MGNISSMARASTALDSYVAELGNDISYDKSLSSSRFLKTILARHAYGPVVLKIFIKPDVAMSLRPIQRRLKAEREALSDMQSVHSYQTFVETEKAGYLIRQWAGANLYDRVSIQPYLANIEKKWIAFQLLTCLRDARTRKVGHGDIKSENVLVASDLSVMLTDFSSSFKPIYLPLDDPSDFSFFFDTSSRRTCYIAPERFYEADSKQAKEKTQRGRMALGEEIENRDGRVTEEMDVFSCGCVLAELWTDGRAVFNLSELFAYKAGSLGLNGLLDNIDDAAVREMISQMLAREPNDRPSFDHVLSSFRDSIFPEYFYTFLKDYATSLSELPDSSPANPDGFLKKVASQPGTKVDRLLEEWDSISIHLEKGIDESGPALLLLNMVTSSIRNCIWPSSRLHGLQLFLNLNPHLQDEDRIDRTIPFVVELLSDEVAVVRAEACRVLVQVVESVQSITPQNSTYIPEYLLPQTRHLASDPDVFVRATYARALVRLADAAVTMLEISQASKPNKADLEASGVVEPDYDSMLVEIQSVVEEQATTLLVDPSSQVKRAFIASIADLCLFFGRQKSNETVLSHIMTYLNDRDWLLRLAFFDGIVDVGAFIGIKAVEEYVLPLMLQALTDSEEAVVARVIASLTSLTSLGLLPRMKIWDVFFAVRGFLIHPDTWIKQGAAAFIAAAARKLSRSDVWCILYPNLRPLLESDILEMDEPSIVSAIVPPLSRGVLVSAKAAALHNTPSGFWTLEAASSTTKMSLVKAANASPSPESSLLREKGFTAADEKKIVALKDFIVKQAHSSKAREHYEASVPPEHALVSTKSVSLTDLGVTPQTVFISPRTVGVDAKADLKRLRPLLGEVTSRRTSLASRSNRGATDNPVDQLRNRLATMESPTTIKTPERVRQGSEPPVAPSEGTPSESAISSTLDLSAIPRTGKKRADTKGAPAPAIAATHANAIGTTTIHDEPASGRSTPTIGLGRPSTLRAAPYASSYEGHDPGVRAFLEQVDLENYREPLLDFGPRVLASHRKRAPRPKTSNNPQGVTLIGHLTHHTDGIVSIVTSPDQTFFATASEDCTVLIWDSAKLERSIACDPRRSYIMESPITAMCRIENTHCLAVASEDGEVHVLRVHVSTTGGSAKYGKVECIRKWRTEGRDGHVKFLCHLSDSTLLLFTTTSVIARLDIRNMEITKRYQHPLEHGVVTAVCPTAHWVVVGTAAGTLSLWDLRFGLIVKSWNVDGRITALQLHPARGKGLWLMVSTVRKQDDAPLVKVYDIETSKLVEVYDVRSTKPASVAANPSEGQETVRTKAQLIAELASGESTTVSDLAGREPTHSVQAMIVGQSFASLVTSSPETGLLSVPERSTPQAPGWMVTAGDDRVVRYWDLVKTSDSFVVCGSQKERDVSFKHNSSDPDLYYTLPNVHRQQPTNNHHAGIAQHSQPLRPHYDAISALSAVETPFSSCVISGDRSGIVKVWRMEGQAKQQA